MSIRERGVHLVYRAATGSRGLRLLLTPVVAVSYLLFATAFACLALLADSVFSLPGIPPEPLNVYLSLPLTGTGLFLAGWCLVIFLGAKGTPVPFNPPPRLLTQGPYAYMRNPMLSGVFLILFGAGIFLQSVFLIFVFTPLFIALNVIEIKMIEEPELALRLGKEYLAYKKRTPMFFPELIRKRKGKP
jgi:protein-S-isoprenylcysteine O-methyltransferase Ste14